MRHRRGGKKRSHSRSRGKRLKTYRMSRGGIKL